MKPLLDKYLEEHPNVVLDEESVSNADLATKVQTLAAGDELPDVFMVKGQMAQTFVENGKMYALDDILAEDPQWRDNFKEGVFSNFTIDEKIYAIPFQVTNTCVFYNTDLFAQAGIKEFPKTWDELIDIIPDLKSIGVTPIVLGNKEKWNAESVIMSTLGNRLTAACCSGQFQCWPTRCTSDPIPEKRLSSCPGIRLPPAPAVPRYNPPGGPPGIHPLPDGPQNHWESIPSAGLPSATKPHPPPCVHRCR